MNKFVLFFTLFISVNSFVSQYDKGMFYPIRGDVEVLKKTKTIVLFKNDFRSDLISAIKSNLEESWHLTDLVYIEKDSFVENYNFYNGSDEFSYLVISRDFDVKGYLNEGEEVVSLMLGSEISKILLLKLGSRLYASSHVSQHMYGNLLVAQRLVQILTQTFDNENALNRYWDVVKMDKEFVNKLKDNVLHIPVQIPSNIIKKEHKDAFIRSFKSRLPKTNKKYPFEIEYVSMEEVQRAYYAKKENYLYIEYGHGVNKKKIASNFMVILDCETQLPFFTALMATDVSGDGGLDVVMYRKLTLQLRKAMKKMDK